MLIEKEFDKAYPELPECEVNDRDCEFDVSAVCHECGTPMCDACAIGLRHQPQLVKYEYEEGTGTERHQHHCPDCFEGHWINWRLAGGGVAGVALGAIILYTSGVSSVPLAVLALVLLLVGAWALRTEIRLKYPDNDNYLLTDLL